MKERPILFSGPMVRAILHGRKTQTRRPMKPQPDPRFGEPILQYGSDWVPAQCVNADLRGAPSRFRCPFGQTGDRLWVRETFIHEPAEYILTVSVSHPVRPEVLSYRADYPESKNGEGWRPSIHMPRWASRITLEITRVWVERVQDISRGDAMAEGCPFANMSDGPDPRSWFGDLWQSIYGTWESNPWVWAVEFRMAKP